MKKIALLLFSLMVLNISGAEYKIKIIKAPNKNISIYPKKINDSRQIAGIYVDKEKFRTVFLLDTDEDLWVLPKTPLNYELNHIDFRKYYWRIEDYITVKALSNTGDILVVDYARADTYLFQGTESVCVFNNYFHKPKGLCGNWQLFGDNWIWKNGIFTCYDDVFKEPFRKYAQNSDIQHFRIHDVNSKGLIVGELTEPFCVFASDQDRVDFMKLEEYFCSLKSIEDPITEDTIIEMDEYADWFPQYYLGISVNDKGMVMIGGIDSTYIWDRVSGQTIYIPRFSGIKINNSGVVIGHMGQQHTPTIWDNGKIIKIEDLLVGINGISDLTELDLNNNGDILCWCRIDDAGKTIVLERNSAE